MINHAPTWSWIGEEAGLHAGGGLEQAVLCVGAGGHAIAAIVVPHFTGNKGGFRLVLVKGDLQQISSNYLFFP